MAEKKAWTPEEAFKIMFHFKKMVSNKPDVARQFLSQPDDDGFHQTLHQTLQAQIRMNMIDTETAERYLAQARPQKAPPPAPVTQDEQSRKAPSQGADAASAARKEELLEMVMKMTEEDIRKRPAAEQQKIRALRQQLMRR